MTAARSTQRQRRGAWAERLAATYLEALGWRVLATNVRLGRDELDIVAIEPVQPATLVAVEVRGLHSRLFGSPEERVDAGKVRRLYRAAAVLRQHGTLQGIQLPAAWRVDLVIVDARESDVRIRHLRALEPP